MLRSLSARCYGSVSCLLAVFCCIFPAAQRADVSCPVALRADVWGCLRLQVSGLDLGGFSKLGGAFCRVLPVKHCPKPPACRQNDPLQGAAVMCQCSDSCSQPWPGGQETGPISLTSSGSVATVGPWQEVPWCWCPASGSRGAAVPADPCVPGCDV